MILHEVEHTEQSTTQGWICPKCNSSVSPTNKTCPKCEKINVDESTLDDRQVLID